MSSLGCLRSRDLCFLPHLASHGFLVPGKKVVFPRIWQVLFLGPEAAFCGNTDSHLHIFFISCDSS